MRLELIDWLVVLSYFAITLFIGIWVSKKSGKNSTEYFSSKKGMPWWLLGMSMVATTFSTDTPNLVTDIVRKNGVSGNWVWWAFILTGMLTVFIYARLWKRSKVLTDVEFYELRYSGKAAAFLRGFRSIYLGVFFNVIIMAAVSLAAIKIAGVMLGISPITTILIAGAATALYSAIGGFRGVILTDFLLFFLSILGGFAAAFVALKHPEVGGLASLLEHPNVAGKLSILPDFNNKELLVSVFIIPIAVQWWSVWYPGAEPGGGGYIAQRMLAAKDENHAIKSVFFFNFAHYVVRPWPWIIVALCSLIVFPDLASLQAAFPNVPADKIGHDLGYSAMLTFLPVGLLGMVIVSLIAAYMSTISTHLNWGSSYVVNDFYKRFAKPNATEKELVLVGRISTVFLMVLSGIVALALTNAMQAFQILLQIGAGTGLIFILRWFWWRINAWSEITAMSVSFILALCFQLIPNELSGTQHLLIGICITTLSWLAVSFLTPATEEGVLIKFLKTVRPGGPGWKKLTDKMVSQGGALNELADSDWKVPQGILCMVLGSVFLYSALFGTGYWIYAEPIQAIILTVICVISGGFLAKIWRKLQAK